MAFVDALKVSVDGGFRSITNNLAHDLFGDGTGSRGEIGTYSKSGSTVTIQLANENDIVFFEKGMTLVASLTSGGAPSADTIQLTAVNRASGVIVGTASTGASPLSANWAVSSIMSVEGDLPSAGASSTADFLAIAGLAAWLPKVSPTSGDNFFGVDRSVDPTRLAGLRYDATAFTIEEGMTNALAFVNREGGRPDLCVMDFASFAALSNALGAKVQYVQVEHDEVQVAFEGIIFQSAYGKVNVLADRSCPPQTAYLLTMNTWKLRSLGKVPKILTYGIEGLDGLRVGNADALEVRIGYYAQLTCSAPGFNCVVSLSN